MRRPSHVQHAVLLGGNTSSGFHSLYHELSRPEEMQALYILKGGPGCGKSTLMRRVARHARAAGLDTEEIPCSGDPDSLDGLLLPALGTAIVDGTAPHVVEAGCPGAVDRYVDLSCFYDRQALQPLKEKLLSAAKEYRGHYKGAYRCLGAAGELGRNVWEAVSAPEVEEKLARRARGIIGRELKKTGGGAGRLSQRFLSALTCRGRLTLWETVEAQADRVYELRDQYGLAHQLLSPILAAALAAGHGRCGLSRPPLPRPAGPPDPARAGSGLRHLHPGAALAPPALPPPAAGRGARRCPAPAQPPQTALHAKGDGRPGGGRRWTAWPGPRPPTTAWRGCTTPTWTLRGYNAPPTPWRRKFSPRRPAHNRNAEGAGVRHRALSPPRFSLTANPLPHPAA